MSRHFFPGGNTPSGFHNYFNYIPWDGERTIHLKGASGCGKSTFMKKAAADAESRGYKAEYFHCSNDAGSLDGIRIPEAKVCIDDGTAPHVSDPAVPVAYDEIFNMAEFIDPEAVSKHKDELFDLMRRKKQCFDKAYNYLAAAQAVHRNNTYIYANALNLAGLNMSILETLSVFDGRGQSGKPGRNRQLFASAITPDGCMNFVHTLTDTNTIFALTGETGTGTHILLERVRETANLCSFDTESLYCPLNPGKLEHLIIPELDLLFTTKSRYHDTDVPTYAAEIFFEEFLDISAVEESREEVEYNETMLGELIGKAVQTFASQRILHERIEEIYIAGMDFDRLTHTCDEIIARLMK